MLHHAKRAIGFFFGSGSSLIGMAIGTVHVPDEAMAIVVALLCGAAGQIGSIAVRMAWIKIKTNKKNS